MAKRTMTPSEALVETLVAEGVTDVFGLVGSAFMDALDLFPDAGIRFIPVAHEQAAAHAADGLARVTGRPQACIAQNGPGAANFVSAIAAAFWAHSPVVAITPETGSLGIGTGGFQELDQMPMFEAQTVFQVRVNRPERMGELARRCFYRAKLELGPTHLNIPRDYFYGDIEEDIFATPSLGPGRPPKGDIEEAVRLLSGARYPVIVSGGGVSQGDALEEVKAVAEHLSAPVVNTYLHNDTFPWSHELGCGPIGYCGSKAAMRTIAKADVVLALGTRLGVFGLLPQYDMTYWPEDATLIQVDRDARQWGMSRIPALFSVADVKEYAVELLDELRKARPDPGRNEARIADVAREKRAWDEELEGWSSSTNALMHPRRFLWEFTRALPGDALVTTDIGNTCSITNGYLRFDGPRQHLAALTWGNCGFAYGAALGARVGNVGNPAAPVFAIQGDGAWGISGMSEVMTAVREEIPVIAVVINNHEWGAEKKNQIDFYDNRFVGTNLRANPDFAEVAEAMGAKGYRVEDYRDVKDVVRDAIASGRPCVINAVVEGGARVLAEPFRRDALAMPTRHLQKYAHLSLD
ncbi:MAG: sulfoacetaldehyde acetyltransferase [Gammaproteobacteria bacterium]|nr:sulfoacetaldehyde acetyltransferase [Gammaproteobacteria bacterium]